MPARDTATTRQQQYVVYCILRAVFQYVGGAFAENWRCEWNSSYSTNVVVFRENGACWSVLNVCFV